MRAVALILVLLIGGAPWALGAHDEGSTRCLLNPEAEYPVGLSGLTGVAVEHDGRHLVVASHDEHLVRILDKATGASLATLAVESRPWEVDIDSGTDRAFVSNFGAGTVSIVDLDRLAIDGTIPVGSQPTGLEVDGEAGIVWVATKGAGQVVGLSTATGAVIASIATGGNPQALALDVERGWLFVGHGTSRGVDIVDVASKVIISHLPTGTTAHDIGADPVHGWLYIGSSTSTVQQWDYVRGVKLGTLSLGDNVAAVTVDPTRSCAYLTGDSTSRLWPISHEALHIVGSYATGSGPSFLDVDPSDGTVYVSNHRLESRSISVYSSSTPPACLSGRVMTPSVSANPSRLVGEPGETLEGQLQIKSDVDSDWTLSATPGWDFSRQGEAISVCEGGRFNVGYDIGIPGGAAPGSTAQFTLSATDGAGRTVQDSVTVEVRDRPEVPIVQAQWDGDTLAIAAQLYDTWDGRNRNAQQAWDEGFSLSATLMDRERNTLAGTLLPPDNRANPDSETFYGRADPGDLDDNTIVLQVRVNFDGQVQHVDERRLTVAGGSGVVTGVVRASSGAARTSGGTAMLISFDGDRMAAVSRAPIEIDGTFELVNSNPSSFGGSDFWNKAHRCYDCGVAAYDASENLIGLATFRGSSQVDSSVTVAEEPLQAFARRAAEPAQALLRHDATLALDAAQRTQRVHQDDEMHDFFLDAVGITGGVYSAALSPRQAALDLAVVVAQSAALADGSMDQAEQDRLTARYTAMAEATMFTEETDFTGKIPTPELSTLVNSVNDRREPTFTEMVLSPSLTIDDLQAEIPTTLRDNPMKASQDFIEALSQQLQNTGVDENFDANKWMHDMGQVLAHLQSRGSTLVSDRLLVPAYVAPGHGPGGRGFGAGMTVARPLEQNLDVIEQLEDAVSDWDERAEGARKLQTVMTGLSLAAGAAALSGAAAPFAIPAGLLFDGIGITASLNRDRAVRHSMAAVSAMNFMVPKTLHAWANQSLDTAGIYQAVVLSAGSEPGTPAMYHTGLRDVANRTFIFMDEAASWDWWDRSGTDLRVALPMHPDWGPQWGATRDGSTFHIDAIPVVVDVPPVTDLPSSLGGRVPISLQVENWAEAARACGGSSPLREAAPPKVLTVWAIPGTQVKLDIPYTVDYAPGFCAARKVTSSPVTLQTIRVVPSVGAFSISKYRDGAGLEINICAGRPGGSSEPPVRGCEDFLDGASAASAKGPEVQSDPTGPIDLPLVKDVVLSPDERVWTQAFNASGLMDVTIDITASASRRLSLAVADSEGRVLGFDPQGGGLRHEIGGEVVDGPTGTRSLRLFDPPSGVYDLRVVLSDDYNASTDVGVQGREVPRREAALVAAEDLVSIAWNNASRMGTHELSFGEALGRAPLHNVTAEIDLVTAGPARLGLGTPQAIPLGSLGPGEFRDLRIDVEACVVEPCTVENTAVEGNIEIEARALDGGVQALTIPLRVTLDLDPPMTAPGWEGVLPHVARNVTFVGSQTGLAPEAVDAWTDVIRTVAHEVGALETRAPSYLAGPSRNATLIFWSVDEAGNREPSKSLNVTFDADAPSSWTVPALNGTSMPTGSAFVVSATDNVSGDAFASGVATIPCKIEAPTGQVWELPDCSSPVELAGDDGEYVIEHWAVDNVGNEGEHIQEIVWLDATDPHLEVRSPANGAITIGIGPGASVTTPGDRDTDGDPDLLEFVVGTDASDPLWHEGSKQILVDPGLSSPQDPNATTWNVSTAGNVSWAAVDQDGPAASPLRDTPLAAPSAIRLGGEAGGLSITQRMGSNASSGPFAGVSFDLLARASLEEVAVVVDLANGSDPTDMQNATHLRATVALGDVPTGEWARVVLPTDAFEHLEGPAATPGQALASVSIVAKAANTSGPLRWEHARIDNVRAFVTEGPRIVPEGLWARPGTIVGDELEVQLRAFDPLAKEQQEGNLSFELFVDGARRNVTVTAVGEIAVLRSSIPDLADGAHAFEVVARDAVGQEATRTGSFIVADVLVRPEAGRTSWAAPFARGEA